VSIFLKLAHVWNRTWWFLKDRPHSMQADTIVITTWFTPAKFSSVHACKWYCLVNSDFLYSWMCHSCGTVRGDWIIQRNTHHLHRSAWTCLCQVNLMLRWREMGSVVDRQCVREWAVWTPQLIAILQESITNGTKKPMKSLSWQVGALRSCQQVLHDLHLKQYHISVVQKSCLGDAHHCVHYCEWLLEYVTKELVNPLQYFITDKAWLHLSGYINSQKSQYWATKDPHIIHKELHYDQKVAVWFALSCHWIVRSIFFCGTISTGE
jgi:hypothetical protein